MLLLFCRVLEPPAQVRATLPFSKKAAWTFPTGCNLNSDSAYRRLAFGSSYGAFRFAALPEHQTCDILPQMRQPSAPAHRPAAHSICTPPRTPRASHAA